VTLQGLTYRRVSRGEKATDVFLRTQLKTTSTETARMPTLITKRKPRIDEIDNYHSRGRRRNPAHWQKDSDAAPQKEELQNCYTNLQHEHHIIPSPIL